MKKYIISVLLVMVVLFTVTACINSNKQLAVSSSIEQKSRETTSVGSQEQESKETTSVDSQEQESKETTSVDSQEQESKETTSVGSQDQEIKVRLLTYSEIEKMGSNEISDFFVEMVSISETETLSIDDMYLMGCNFFNIWDKNPSCDQDDFEIQSYKAFCNIYNQALESQIPLEQLSSWTYLPVTSILEKYFSSNNFKIPEAANCYALLFLSEEDITTVAEIFFKNPVMSSNTIIPHFVIELNYNNSATDMAWLRFEELSKSDSPKTSQDVVSFTEQVCADIVTLNKHMEKVSKIATNILDNPYYDICTKYSYFCNAFYNHAIGKYTDDTIANIAIDSLFELAENADAETCNQLKKLAKNLYTDLADKLLGVLEENIG